MVDGKDCRPSFVLVSNRIQVISPALDDSLEAHTSRLPVPAQPQVLCSLDLSSRGRRRCEYPPGTLIT